MSVKILINGGYGELHGQMIRLKNKGVIKEIGGSAYNGLNPPLKTKWQINNKEIAPCWKPAKLLQYADLLDFSYYINNPAYQTETEWDYIENIYAFLKDRDEREWVSVEERSLELFYDEKFLTGRKDSTFFTYKRIAEVQGDILGFTPDMLIYGEGKKIEQEYAEVSQD